ncbi:FAD-binding domain-containing protein [Daedaleopsis nitida]|nr:FAD-binding domain-containing protein [Daedaleopsis nitida]
MESLQLQGTILTLSNGESYTTALKRNSDLSILPAAYIVQPATFADIPPVLAYAAAQTPPIEIAVKGGGAHSSTWASSDGGIVIDLSKLNEIVLAPDRRSITVQGGHFGETLDVVGSPLWFVGVGGFTLGGGYGPLSGKYGLAIDNLLTATVVLADGRLVKTSKDEEPDLFWAIRGGGGQFGIVVEFVFKTHPFSGPFCSGLLVYPGSEFDGVLETINEWKKTQTPTERLTMHFSRQAPYYKPSVVIFSSMLHDTDGSRAATAFSPFRYPEHSITESTLPPRPKPLVDQAAVVPDFLTLSHGADKALALAPRRLVIRGTMFADFFPELLRMVWEKWLAFTESSMDVRASAVLWDLTVPDRIADIKGDETALKTREPHYWMAVQGRSTTDESVEACRTFAAEVVQLVREKNTELSGSDLGWFLNMCQGDERPEDVFGENLPRLRKIKAKYDPKKMFSKGVAIEPLLDDLA